jgi:hypothetical protein
MKPLLRCILSLLLLPPLSALAAGPTALTILNVKQNNYAVQPGDLTITFTGCDAVNGNSFYATGNEVLLVQNADGASPHGFTVNSVPDTFGRTDTSLTSYSVGASVITALQLKYLTGWRQSNGTVTLACNSTQIKFAVLHYS